LPPQTATAAATSSPATEDRDPQAREKEVLMVFSCVIVRRIEG
jgi:hypothetical protein